METVGTVAVMTGKLGGGILCEINYNTEGELVPLCSQVWVVRGVGTTSRHCDQRPSGDRGDHCSPFAPEEWGLANFQGPRLHSLDLGTHRMAGDQRHLGTAMLGVTRKT